MYYLIRIIGLLVVQKSKSKHSLLFYGDFYGDSPSKSVLQLTLNQLLSQIMDVGFPSILYLKFYHPACERAWGINFENKESFFLMIQYTARLASLEVVLFIIESSNHQIIK